jgi:hypothetical protein
MKQKLFIIMIVLSLFYVPTGFANAFKPGGAVQVSIPSFETTVNQVKVDNTKEKYPLVVFNEMIYFPLTQNYAGALGMDLNWSASDGLSIDNNQSGPTEIIPNRGVTNSTTQKYQASIPKFNIYVNQKKINNAKEDYPFILFRDITYMPMTWRYGITELGLDLSFDKKSGFRLSNSKTNVKLDATQEEALQRQIYDLVSPSVVKIETFDKNNNRLEFANGIVVSKDGKIVTSYNFLKSSAHVNYAKVTLNNGKEYKVTEVVDYDAAHNLVAIKIDDSAEFKAVKLGASKMHKDSQKVYGVSFPNQFAFNLFPGTITFANKNVRNTSYIHATAITSPGDALVNDKGELIGISAGIKSTTQANYYFVPIEKFNKLTFDRKAQISELYEYEK